MEWLISILIGIIGIIVFIVFLSYLIDNDMLDVVIGLTTIIGIIMIFTLIVHEIIF